MHALLTGASSGIGEALARAMAANGYDLTLIARRWDELERVAADLRSRVRVFVQAFDLSDVESIPRMFSRAEEALGAIDVLVNNAGMDIVDLAAQVPPATIDALIDVNLRAPLHLTHLALAGMLARGAGVVVDVTSVAAFSHPPLQAHYSTSKAGLAAYSVSLRRELRKTGVHVVTVYPGPIDTPLARRVAGATTAPAFLLPWGNVHVLARRIMRAIRLRRATVVYPRFYWLPRLFPHVARMLLDRVPATLRDVP